MVWVWELRPLVDMESVETIVEPITQSETILTEPGCDSDEVALFRASEIV